MNSIQRIKNFTNEELDTALFGITGTNLPFSTDLRAVYQAVTQWEHPFSFKLNYSAFLKLVVLGTDNTEERFQSSKVDKFNVLNANARQRAEALYLTLIDKWSEPGDQRNVCPECDGTGGVDSGGVTPWMEPIFLPCPACQSEPNAKRSE